MFLLWIIILLFAGYSVLIIYYWLTWRSIPGFLPSTGTANTRISVIIPARNEENNIGVLLKALNRQDYPPGLFEIIVVDDHSDDRTAEIAEEYGARLIRLNEGQINSYKKKAIETGIAAAAGELIVTTDADCIPGEKWLSTLAAFKEETGAVFIAAPVVIDCDPSILQVFQSLDFMVLQGITGAVVYTGKMSMCNGANLAYEKEIFHEVRAFAGIDHIASGDDMLLMHKIAQKYPGRAHYLKSKDAIVATRPAQSWKEFFRQRIRWASKARAYDDKRIFPVLLLVYLFNLSFIVLAGAGFAEERYWIAAACLLLLKTLVEYPFFISLAEYFDKRWAIKWFPLFQPMHIMYTVLAGFLGQFGTYEWKGRRVN